MRVTRQRAVIVKMLAILITLAGLGRLAATDLSGAARQDRQDRHDDERHGSERGGFEVWIVDQSDTRPGFGGQLLIYAGSDLRGDRAADAQPTTRVDLGGAVSDACLAATGRRPVRPHMLVFNTRQSHAVLSFVASGHVVVLNAETRAPLTCLETTIGSTGTRQAHAAFPSPDGDFILVANQNGKRLERIDTNFSRNRFEPNPAATLDLATCTTPGGNPCEHPDLRPINWPICPVIDASSTYGFVTLRGGGLLVVNARTTPMTIVAEYDRSTVRGNGCGGIQVDGHMYINSGGSPVNVSGTDPHHPDLYGFDVYRFALSGLSRAHAPNTPAPTVLLSKTGMSDSHGTAVAGWRQRYLWVLDRHANVAEIIDVRSGRWVNTVQLAGAMSADPAPDLAANSPDGDRLFVSLRGSVPLSGDPHNATGTTPGLGVIHVSRSGKSGRLAAIVPLVNPWQQPKQSPDPHGLRVRLRKSRHD
jgi:hypothetical protein